MLETFVLRQLRKDDVIRFLAIALLEVNETLNLDTEMTIGSGRNWNGALTYGMIWLKLNTATLNRIRFSR